MNTSFCDICNVECGNVYNYKSHIGGKAHKKAEALNQQRVFPIPLVFICPFCNKDFGTNETNFNTHERSKQHKMKAAQQLFGPLIAQQIKRQADTLSTEELPSKRLNTTYSLPQQLQPICEESVSETELTLCNPKLVNYTVSEESIEEAADVVNRSPPDEAAAVASDDDEAANDDDVSAIPSSSSYMEEEDTYDEYISLNTTSEDEDVVAIPKDKQQTNNSGYESGELSDSFNLDEEVIPMATSSPTTTMAVPVSPTTPFIFKTPHTNRVAHLSPIIGFLDKVTVCNPDLLFTYHAPQTIPQFCTAEKKRRQRIISETRYMQRATHYGGEIDEGGYWEIPPRYKKDLRPCMLLPKLLATFILCKKSQAGFMLEMQNAFNNN